MHRIISVFKKIHTLYGNDGPGKLEWGVSERSRMAQFVEHLLASREPWIQNPELRKWRWEGIDVQGRPQLYSLECMIPCLFQEKTL